MQRQSHSVPTVDGLGLNVWERAPGDADEAVLFVHGVLTNARALFDTPVAGDDSYSWLRAAATRGRAAFAMDQRGYGDSDRPAAMREPPEANEPPVRADRAAADIATVVDWIRRRFQRVHLVGVSWGCHTCGRYLERPDPPVVSHVQCAPVYAPDYDRSVVEDALGVESLDVAYFEQDRETVRARSSHPPAVFDALWRAQVDSNQGIDADTYVAQAGGIADWLASIRGEPVWAPSCIDVPTMVFYGGDDAIADRHGSLACFDRLAGTDNEYVEVTDVDHYPMHSERRGTLFDLVSDFQDRVG